MISTVFFFGVPVTEPAGSSFNIISSQFLFQFLGSVASISLLICSSSLSPALILSINLNLLTFTFFPIIPRSFLSKSTTIVCSAISFIFDKIFSFALGIDASIVPFIGYVKILLFLIFTNLSGEKHTNLSLNNSLKGAFAIL